jgi:hypothetical protein
MRAEQCRWSPAGGWEPSAPGRLGRQANLVFLFSSPEILKQHGRVEEIRRLYPDAILFGGSTAGEICGAQVSDGSLVVTAIHFEHTRLQSASIAIAEDKSSYRVGERLARSLDRDGLVHVFVLSDGLKINGTELVNGLTSNLPSDVTITGGLAGDGSRFKETLVLSDSVAAPDTISALGFHGDRLKVGFGSLGGWDPFGPERLVTRSIGNVLYEMDGRSALELYKTYLGDHAKGLPATGLLFPLSLRINGGAAGVVRTILSVDDHAQTMTFAGDVPQGSYARLMKANFDRLIDGAVGAAKTSCGALGSTPADVAILISCVGRKLVLKQRVEEEVEGVRDVVGNQAALTGFYSYGELSPFGPNSRCELHNQTMTITTFAET